MVKLVFSDPELAIAGGAEYFKEIEENVFVMPVFYPSGVEYHLKREREVLNDKGCIRKYRLTKRHRFHSMQNALKGMKYFLKKGFNCCVKKKRKVEKGYNLVKYYYLCST